MSHLSNAAINLVALRDYYRAELQSLLNLPAQGLGAKERKALVLDKTLSGPLGLVAEVDLLRANGVDQIHHLRDLELHTPCLHVLYLVRPSLANMRLIASHILNHRAREPQLKRTYTLLLVPRRSMLCEKELEALGVLGDVHMADFPLELIPFDEDVLSLELNSAFRDTSLDGDPAALLSVARALVKLQAIYGLVPTVKGKGSQALKVWHLMQRLRREAGVATASGSAASAAAGDIDSIILLDRSVDLVTPLLTQLTYEGLIDELFGIKNSFIDVEAELIGGNSSSSSKPGAAATPAPAPGQLRKLQLNSADSLFKETRDLNFRVLGPLLHKKAEYIKETYSERHAAQTVNEMHSFMQKFKTAHAEHALLQTHINLAERIASVFKSKAFDRRVEMERMLLEGNDTETVEEYIENCICRAEPPSHVLRILCLLSLTQGGVRPKKFDHLRREFLHTYGFHWLFTLDNLERLGMLASAASLRTPSAGGRGWPALRKGLRLTTPQDKPVDVSNPTDTNYVFNGYAPLSVRLVEIGQRPLGWKRHEELLSLIPGKTFEFTQEPGGVVANPVNLLEPLPGSSSATAAGGIGGGGRGAGGINIPGWAGGSGGGDKDWNEPAPTPSNKDAAGGGSRKKPLTLVVFLGGASVSEISALRFLSERDDHARDYLVATTKLTNGASFVESLQEQVANKLNGGTGLAGANYPATVPYPMVNKQATQAATPTAAGATAQTPTLGKR